MEPSVQTSTALSSRMARRVLLRRYKPRSVISATTIAENVEARKFLPGPDPEAVIAVIPEDVQLNLSLVGKEPHTVLGLDAITRVKAWVAEGRLFNEIADLHFPDLPSGLHFKVFSKMDEAVTWVKQMLAGDEAASPRLRTVH